MAQHESQAGSGTDPEGSIFLSQNSQAEQKIPDLEELVASFLGPDWEQADRVLDDIGTHYPRMLRWAYDRLQTALIMQRGGVAHIQSDEHVLGEVEVRSYLYELVTRRRRALGALALQGPA